MVKKINVEKKNLLTEDKKVPSKFKRQRKDGLLEPSYSSRKRNPEVLFTKILTKSNFVTFFLFLLDIVLIIWFARRNVVNYVEILDKEIFVSKTRYLFFGRNYITLVVTAFFYIYTLVLQKVFFKRKLTRKYLVLMFIFYLLFNLILFYLFTKRVY